MTSPAFVSVGSQVAGRNIASLAPAYPASPVSGNIAILAFQFAGGSPGTVTLSPSTGWVAIGSAVVSGAGPLTPNNSYLWYKILNGTESGSVTVNFTNIGFTMSASANISYWSGVDTSGTVVEGLGTNSSGATATATGVAVTTTGVNRLVLMVTTGGNSNNGTDTSPAPSGWTNRFDQWAATGGSEASLLKIDTIAQASAGTVPAGSFAFSPVANWAWCTHSFALIGGPQVSANGASAGQSSVNGSNPIRTAVTMARYLDRAQMTVSGAPGTGAVTLNAAVAPNQTWAAAATAQGRSLAAGDVFWAVAQDSNGAWEIWPATILNTVGPVLSAPDATDPRFQSSTGIPLSLSSAATVFSDLPALIIGLNSDLMFAAFGGQG